MKRIGTLMMMLLAMYPILLAQTADEVIDTYFERSGGKDNFRNVETLKLSGTVSTLQGDFPLEIYQKSPDKIYVTLDVMGQRIISQASDGVTVWSYNPFAGSTTAQKLNENDATIFKEEAGIDGPFMDYAQRGYIATYEGTATKGDKACHVVKLTKDLEGTAFVLTGCFDTETYLPVTISRAAGMGQNAGQFIENYYDKYQDTGNGLIMPFEMETFIDGNSMQKLIFQSIDVNDDISDDLFTYPGN